jgi:ArsR family transcriptional regulator
MELETFSKALADQTRLRIVLLVAHKGELCVCELTQSLELAQPKISRHLAILRESGVLLDRKAGLWVYYRLHPALAAWAQTVIQQFLMGSANEAIYQADLQRLQTAHRLSDNACCA